MAVTSAGGRVIVRRAGLTWRVWDRPTAALMLTRERVARTTTAATQSGGEPSTPEITYQTRSPGRYRSRLEVESTLCGFFIADYLQGRGMVTTRAIALPRDPFRCDAHGPPIARANRCRMPDKATRRTTKPYGYSPALDFGARFAHRRLGFPSEM